MNILYCTNSNYVIPLCVSITSLIENNKKIKINIFIFHSELKEEELKNIKLLESNNIKINLIKIDEKYFDHFPTFRWAKEAYYRLLISELLPTDLKRILYLDCDTIINKNILDLYNIDLEKYFIGALNEGDYLDKNKNRLGLKNNSKYYQTGVMIIEFEKIKECLIYKKIERIFNSLGEKLEVVDQDIINVIFEGKIKDINKYFNNTEITRYKNNFSRFFNIIDEKEFERTAIFHFATGKPWNNLYSGSCEEIWYKYLKISPYSEIYKQKYSNLKYKILRSGLLKIVFYEYIHITPFINKFAAFLFPKYIYNKLKKYYRENIK